MGFDNSFDDFEDDYTDVCDQDDQTLIKRNLIEEWMNQHAFNVKSAVLTKYNISDDLKITAVTDCSIRNWVESELPFYIQFEEALGSFSVANLPLETLRGCPRIVCGTFHASNTNIINLEGGPQTVYGDALLSINKRLESLKGTMQVVGGEFNISGDVKLKSLEGIPQARYYSYINVPPELNAKQYLGGKQ